ncbi:MAG: TIGR03790 family protein [bacterium]|nr:TIGR03790 family protein [bacterium]
MKSSFLFAACLCLLSTTAPAQNDNAVLVVDPNDAESLYVANYYAAARGIPASHVLYLDPDAANYATFVAENLVGFQGELVGRGIESQVDVVIVPPGGNFFTSIPAGTINDGCAAVTRVAIGSAFTTAFITDDILNGINSTAGNQYSRTDWDPIAFDSQTGWLAGLPSTSPSARRYYIGAMLGYTGERGNTVPEILDMIDRSVAADGSQPAGTAYYMQTTDPARSGPRHGAYPTAVTEMAAAGGSAQHLFADLPLGQHDALGIMTGRATLPIDSGDFTLLPGSFADHLTSFAGNFTTASQTKMSRWIAKGASGTAGTVQEPCNYAGKFPHARFHVLYRKGLSIGEAWLRSSGFVPFQGLLYGDPQTRPYASPPTVALMNPPPATPVGGVQVFTPTGQATAPGAQVAHFEMLVDGVSIDTVAPGSDLYLDTRRLSDGWHELRILAADDTPVAHTGRWIGALLVDNSGLAVTLGGPATGDLTTRFDFSFSATGPAVREVRLLQNGRVVASEQAATGTLSTYGHNLGAGPVRVQAEALFDSGSARSAPVFVDVDFTSGPGAGTPPVAYSYERPVRDDSAFVLELPAAFENDPQSVTYTIVQGPAQATVVNPGESGGWRVVEPVAGATGNDTVVYEVSTTAGSAMGTVTLMYEPFVACPPPTNYCVTSANSVGPGGLISSQGSTSVGANDFALECTGLPTGQFGLFYYGINPNQAPLGDGTICIGTPFVRLPVLQTDIFGSAYYPIDIATPPPASGEITVGSTWNFQFWYRDPTHGVAGFNFSDGLEATFCN